MDKQELPKMYVPIEYWSQVLMTLDKKVETIATAYGYGEVSVRITIQNGKVIYTIFQDEIRVKGLADSPVFASPDKVDPPQVIDKR